MHHHYLVSRMIAEKHMENLFAEPDGREPDELPEPVRDSRITRARLRISTALYGLAVSLDPGMPVPIQEPSRQR